MKKVLVVAGFTVALLAVAAFGMVNWAYAQAPDPVNPTCPYCDGTQTGYGPGMMGGRGGFRGQADELGEGPLHDVMQQAMAEAFGLTPEELQAAHDEGKTLAVIAQEQGKTVDEFWALMQEARAKALTQAVADGTVSQEQADWMLQRMNGGFGGRMGNGGCTGYGTRSGGRWAPQP